MGSVHGRKDDPLTVLNTLNKRLAGKNFSDLCKEAQDEIGEELKPLKPSCPDCSSRNCKYRFLNNRSRAKSIQARFLCRSCHVEFTLGGKRYNSRMLHAYNYDHFTTTSLLHNTQTMNNVPTESLIQDQEELGFENTHGAKNNNQGLELQRDNGCNASIIENCYGEADNLFSPYLDNNIYMSDLAWASMWDTNYQSRNSEHLSMGGVGDGYGDHLLNFDAMVGSNVGVPSYGNGMAEQSWNTLYSPYVWNSHNVDYTVTPNMLKECMHNNLGCSCLNPTLGMPMNDIMMGNNLQQQIVSQFWEENPLL